MTDPPGESLTLSFVQVWSLLYTNVVMVQGAAMDVDDDDDPVPEITKRHFEEAMKFARRWDETLWLCLYDGGLYQLLFPGPCPTTTSRSTRCSPRPCSRPEDSATTSGMRLIQPLIQRRFYLNIHKNKLKLSGSPTVPPAARPRRREVRATLPTMMTTTSTVKCSEVKPSYVWISYVESYYLIL